MNQEYTRAPHRQPSAETPLHSAAMLIDFDNVTMGIRSNLGQELRNLMESDVIRGKVAVQRAYADWRRYPQYIVPLSEASIDLIFAPAYGSSKKNATDIRLAIDALELVFIRPEIGTFILLSGDSDFSSLVLKLKEYGKYVIGVGLQESSSDILVQNCDEYYSYNRLSGLTAADEMPTEKHDPWQLVEKAVQRMVDRGDVMRSDRLKQVMLEMDSAFDEKTAGFTKFNRFLAEAAHRDLVRMRKGENGQYEIQPGKGTAAIEEPAPSPSRSGSSGRGGRGGGRGGRSRGGRGRGGRGRRDGGSAKVETSEEKAPKAEAAQKTDDRGSPEAVEPEISLQSAYEELATVVGLMYEDDGSPVRDSMVKRKLLERDATFDEGSLGFRKFSHFLRQAHDEGIVDLEQAHDGNFYLTPATGDDAHPSARKRTSRDESRERDAGAPADRDRETADDRKPSAKRAEPKAEGEGTVESEESASALSAAAAAARRTLGRFRRGSKSSPSTGASSSDADRPSIGPVDSSPDDESQAADEAEDAVATPHDGAADAEPDTDAAPDMDAGPETDAGPAAGSAPDRQAASAPRLGRYRRGSRGGARPVAGATKESDSTRPRIGPVPEDELPSSAGRESDISGDASGNGGSPAGQETRVEDAPQGPPPEAEEVGAVNHMIRNYAGVGKRTAEALYETFGDDIFDVIDHEPDRLEEVLSRGRARAVIEARSRELDA